MEALFDWSGSFSIAPWVALLIIGYCLVVIEMYIPGFGVPGVSGLICMVVGIFFLSGGSFVKGLILTLIMAVLVGLALFVCMRSASKGRIARSKLVLHQTSTTPEGLRSKYEGYVGKIGVSHTPLRPSGVVLIDGQRITVQTDGEFIGENRPVVVTRVEGNIVFVGADA